MAFGRREGRLAAGGSFALAAAALGVGDGLLGGQGRAFAPGGVKVLLTQRISQPRYRGFVAQGVIGFEPGHPDALPDGLCRAEKPRRFAITAGLTGQIGEDLEDVGNTELHLDFSGARQRTLGVALGLFWLALRHRERERAPSAPTTTTTPELPTRHRQPNRVRRLFRDRVQFCSGLVDLVVGVRRHGGGGHRLTLAGERFVGRLTEHIAEVGDRGGDFGDPRRGDGTEREPGDGGRRFVASEPVEKSGEDGQRDADRGGVARIVEVADRQREVIERGQRCRRVRPQVGPDPAPGLTRWARLPLS